MIKKVSFSINNKVIKKEDILLLSDKLFEKYNSCQSGHKKIIFNLSCDDEKQTAYTIENEDLRSEEITMDKKRIDAISMSFLDYDCGRKINLRFSNGSKYVNDLTIEGNEKSWVDSIYTEITELIDGISPQNNFISRNHNIFVFLFGIWFAWLLLWISHAILQTPKSLFSLSELKILIFFIFVYLWTGVYSATIILERVEKLWPNIEFDFGPEHLRKEKRKRKIIWMIITLFIIPLLLQILFLLF